MSSSLSPLARRLLLLHARQPDRLFYGTDALGSMFYDRNIRQLDEAYEELEDEGYMEKSEATVSFFGDSKTLYRLTRKGRRSVEEKVK